LPQDEWHGPLQSARGWHLVRIDTRHESQLLPFEQLQNHLREDWLVKRRNQLFMKHMSKLRARYRIEIDAEGVRG
ncbi:MAG: peptidylprolyl isomerase, partial [Candidatus Competibacteraceae bacterium]|nr:peptidylprolyl isomerase [Candidatus Competibacteraceae bacterium]